MDILLIDPPYIIIKDQQTDRGYNLGLTSLAAYLRDNDIETAILTGDLLMDSSYNNRMIFMIPYWLKANVKDIAAGQRTLESIVNNKNHLIWKKLADVVRRHNPLSVGIAYHTPLKNIVEVTASLVREVNPDIKIIVGSFHPTFCPEEVMQNPDIDFVVRGEGEIPLLQLIRELKKDRPKLEKVRGINYRDRDKQVQSNPAAGLIPDLNKLPLPARDLVLDCDFNRYNRHSLSVTRGCPYSCAFCSDRSLWGGTVRRRSVDNVIDEIRLLKDTYKTDYVEIVDGTFTFDRQYLESFCKTLIDQKLKIKWGCTARYDNLDEDILKLMKKANCWGLYIGLESGSNRVLKSLNKKETVERNMEVTKMIRDSGILQATSILLGSPDEKQEDIEETIKIMKHFKTDFYDINSYMPLPGTPYYNVMSEEDRQAIDWRKVGVKSFSNYFSKHMTREELEGYQKKIYKISNSVRRRSIIRLAVKMALNYITKPIKK